MKWRACLIIIKKQNLDDVKKRLKINGNGEPRREKAEKSLTISILHFLFISNLILQTQPSLPNWWHSIIHNFLPNNVIYPFFHSSIQTSSFSFPTPANIVSVIFPKVMEQLTKNKSPKSQLRMRRNRRQNSGWIDGNAKNNGAKDMKIWYGVSIAAFANTITTTTAPAATNKRNST